jgi:hypothetical protein
MAGGFSLMAEHSFCTEGIQSVSPFAKWHIRKRAKPTALCGCAVQGDVAAEFTEANLKAHGYHICDACGEEYLMARRKSA